VSAECALLPYIRLDHEVRYRLDLRAATVEGSPDPLLRLMVRPKLSRENVG
jgi:hypothetical protein